MDKLTRSRRRGGAKCRDIHSAFGTADRRRPISRSSCSTQRRLKKQTMCADLARDIVAHLTNNSGWQVSVSDETGSVFYKVSVVAECCWGEGAWAVTSGARLVVCNGTADSSDAEVSGNSATHRTRDQYCHDPAAVGGHIVYSCSFSSGLSRNTASSSELFTSICPL